MPTYRNVHTGDVVTFPRQHKRLEKSDRWEKIPASAAKTSDPASSEG